MTPQQFRKLALALPGATEGAHMGHADFRVGGKIFATLGYPDAGWAVVMLEPDQQALLTETARETFSPVPGGWGLKGSTRIALGRADRAAVANALKLAWEIRAPKQKPDPRAMARSFARVRKVAAKAKLPGLETGTSYGTPALKVAGKMLMRMKDAETLVFACGRDEKTMLMEAAPAIYFETDHYVGYPLVLVRAAVADDAELAVCVARAYRAQAPAKTRRVGGAKRSPPRRRG